MVLGIGNTRATAGHRSFVIGMQGRMEIGDGSAQKPASVIEIRKDNDRLKKEILPRSIFNDFKHHFLFAIPHPHVVHPSRKIGRVNRIGACEPAELSSIPMQNLT